MRVVVVTLAIIVSVLASTTPLAESIRPNVPPPEVLRAINAREQPLRAVSPPPAWTPTLSDVSAMEVKLRLPRTSLKLDQYVRYYTGEFVAGRRRLRGYLVAGFFVAEGPGTTDKPGAYIKDPPLQVADGGCGVITVVYEVASRRFDSVICNGLA
jgi:hypothetical protein